MTKQEMVRRHLASGKTLTQSQAYARFGSLRLSHIIWMLRKTHDIHTELIDVKDRFGQPCRVARYRMVR